MGFVGFRVLADPEDRRRDLFDAGREIPPGQTETARVRLRGGAQRLIARAAAGSRPLSIRVSLGDRAVGTLEVPSGSGWTEPTLTLPPDLNDEQSIALTPEGEGWTSFHVWIVDTGGAPAVAGAPPP
jgi:hypothetical protein